MRLKLPPRAPLIATHSRDGVFVGPRREIGASEEKRGKRGPVCANMQVLLLFFPPAFFMFRYIAPFSKTIKSFFSRKEQGRCQRYLVMFLTFSTYHPGFLYLCLPMPMVFELPKKRKLT